MIARNRWFSDVTLALHHAAHFSNFWPLLGGCPRALHPHTPLTRRRERQFDPSFPLGCKFWEEPILTVNYIPSRRVLAARTGLEVTANFTIPGRSSLGECRWSKTI